MMSRTKDIALFWTTVTAMTAFNFRLMQAAPDMLFRNSGKLNEKELGGSEDRLD